MRRILIARDALIDLDLIAESDAATAAFIRATLQQIKADPLLLDALTQNGYGASEDYVFHVSGWYEQQFRYRRNIWRLKLWELERNGIRYRIIYAFDPRDGTHYILGICNRSFDYASDHPFTQRIVAAYDRIEIPGY